MLYGTRITIHHSSFPTMLVKPAFSLTNYDYNSSQIPSAP